MYQLVGLTKLASILSMCAGSDGHMKPQAALQTLRHGCRMQECQSYLAAMALSRTQRMPSR